MSVAVSPEGRALAIGLQGGIWTVPAAGGVAKRITDVFNDARQPAWSPDGAWIAFFAYRDGGYDLWAVAPDGTKQHKLTWGPATIASRRSRTTARASPSDRGDRSANYGIFVSTCAAVSSPATKESAETSTQLVADDKRDRLRVDRYAPKACERGRRGATERKAVTTGACRRGGRGTGWQIVYHAGASGRWRWTKPSHRRHVFPFRPSWASRRISSTRRPARFASTRASGAIATAREQCRPAQAVIRRHCGLPVALLAPPAAIRRPGSARHRAALLSPDGTSWRVRALGTSPMPIGGKPGIADAALNQIPGAGRHTAGLHLGQGRRPDAAVAADMAARSASSPSPRSRSRGRSRRTARASRIDADGMAALGLSGWSDEQQGHEERLALRAGHAGRCRTASASRWRWSRRRSIAGAPTRF